MEEVEADYVKSKLGDSKVILLDVRTPQEFSEGHIPGSVNIDWYQAADMFGMVKKDSELKELFKDIDPSKEVIIYCRSGNRAGYAYGVLERVLGCKNLKLYDGSMLDWDEKNLPTEV